MDYLERDRKTGLLSFRRVYPAELRPYVPRQSRELKRSLSSTDIRAPGAMDRFNAAAAEYERNVTFARKAASDTFDRLDAPTVAYLAEAFRVESLEQDEAARWREGDDKEGRFVAKGGRR